jgi:hypothetical protein
MVDLQMEMILTKSWRQVLHLRISWQLSLHTLQTGQRSPKPALLHFQSSHFYKYTATASS